MTLVQMMTVSQCFFGYMNSVMKNVLVDAQDQGLISAGNVDITLTQMGKFCLLNLVLDVTSAEQIC